METENSYYLVTELCEGGDLMDYICARKYLSEACTRKFIRQIISAVDYLHRIGILHRDLKIENLLLDKNFNIKLIDFGLSNYTKSELCITQCGSPAYAAPELLAHKKYGSKVDVWSIGVNMYAMLTGNLPFTVEPFNIKSLYNKMMKNEMNPIPEHLSKSGEDLLRKLLNPDPLKRISLKEAMEHPWINEGYTSTLKPFPYPNKPTEDQVNPTILRYMNTNMEFNVTEVADNIKTNKPSSSLATYYLLLNKVKTMLMKIDPKKDKLKPRSTDSKPTVKDTVKSSKTTATTTPQTTATTQQSSFSQPQSQQPNALPSMPNAQSPLPRSVKTPGATNITVTTAINNNNNMFAIMRNNQGNKNDATTKYG
jgi:Neu-associated kinase